MQVYYDVVPENKEALPGKGALGARFAFVGIAPSPNRPGGRRNEPFGASSYRFLEGILRQFGDELYVTNLIKTPFQPGKKPPVSLLREWYPWLLRELKGVGITHRVLALGNAPAQVLCPNFTKMREDHGTFFWNPDLQLWVVPTFHFSAMGRDPDAKTYLLRDLERFFTLPDPREPDYFVLDSGPLLVSQLTEGFADISPGSELVIDIETTGLELDATITAVGLWHSHSGTAYILKDPTSIDLKNLMKWLKWKDVTLLGHNMKFDLTRLTRASGISWLKPVKDSMIAAHVNGETVLNLKHLTTHYTDRPGSRAFGGFESLGYLAEDVASTHEIWEQIHRKHAGNVEAPIFELLYNLIPVFSAMMNRGIYIDYERLDELSRHYFDRAAKAQAALDELAPGINWNSPAQVAPVLLEQGVPLSELTPTGNYSTSEPALSPFIGRGYPIVDALFEHRAAAKEATYVASYRELTTPEDPYLRPDLILTGTETGRLSSRNPNVQQVPREGPIKTLYVPRSGTEDWAYGLMDLSQAELRVAALLSNDERLAEFLLSGDAHTEIACTVYGVTKEQLQADQRKKSKGVTFGLMYGGSPHGLAARVGVGVEEVIEVMTRTFEILPRLPAWLKHTGDESLRTLKTYTPMGRVRDLSRIYKLEGPNAVKRAGLNTPIQGFASDIMLLLIRNLSRGLVARRMKTRPLFTIHDSMVLEVYRPELLQLVRLIQESFESLLDSRVGEFPLARELPITGDMVIGKSWAEVESTNLEFYAPEVEYDFSSLGHN